ncbi:MAG TPA: tetratricopeptide repeat protein [Usitatibacter sp.]|nr:tetratricopeptide repeat protein [Usitatibacter sp.]
MITPLEANGIMKLRNWGVGVLATTLLAAAPGVFGKDSAPATEPETSASADSVFEFLVAEVAAQRGDVEAALAIYNRMAKELRNPLLARRAVEMAVRARAFPAAIESAALLLELDPASTLGREIMAALLANESNLDKARTTIAGLLERNPDRAPLLMQVQHLFGKFSDKAAVLRATQVLIEPYSQMAEAHYAVGVAALLADKTDLAGSEVDTALDLRPGWEPGAILKGQVLRKVAPAKVAEFYQEFVTAHPRATDVRMQLGRELAAERKLAEAREQFREVESVDSREGQAPYAVGLLSLQMEEYAEAQAAFTRALRVGYRDAAGVYLGLGQAAEGQKRYEEAIGWYQKVESGDRLRAQLKIATLISKQQGLAAGREFLHRIEPQTGDENIQVLQVEAQLLRDAKAWKETYDMLSQAVLEYPESFELLYDRAMAAERVDRIDVLEADLRRVIKMKPDYAHAYNALGYTLAEKTDRLSEAKDLIEKAYKLSPEDPFILDSLGWVHYRLGNLGDALKHLQAAYGARTDPEIAAHLGEVLWKVGQRDEAQKIWRTALHENPDHETLIAVMQKFRP